MNSSTLDLPPIKVFILCEQNLDSFRQQVFTTLIEAPDIELVGVGVNFRKRKSGLQKIKRELKKGRGGYVIVQVVRKVASKLRKNKSLGASELLAEDFFDGVGVPLYRIQKLFSPETTNLIEESGADCVYLNGFGIIREPLLSLCRFGVISYHHGDLRYYRGGPPAFWELYHGAKEIGVTLQILSPQLDAGKVVLMRHFSITKGKGWGYHKHLIYKGSVSMVVEGLRGLAQGSLSPQLPSELGKVYTLPKLRQWLILHFKVLIGRA